MVNINLSISKKDLFLIVAIIVFIAGAGIIIAYNPGRTVNPSVLGHSLNEVMTCRNISGIFGPGGAGLFCNSDEILLNGGAVCESVSSGCGICACGNLNLLFSSHETNNGTNDGWWGNCKAAPGSGYSDGCVKIFATCCK